MTETLLGQCEALIRSYLQGDGCPCRFPRFRSMTKRDTTRTLGIACTGPDQLALIAAFENIAPIGPRQALGANSEAVQGMWQAKCLRCGSTVERSSHEVVPNGWVDYLVLRRAPETRDLGAPVDRLFRCRPLVPLGAGPHDMRRAATLYPCLDEDAWVAWLSARAQA